MLEGTGDVMGLFDKIMGRGKAAGGNLGDAAKQAKEKAGHVIGENQDKVDGAIDKAAGLADKATKGKFSDKIEKTSDRAKKAAADLADDGDEKPSA